MSDLSLEHKSTSKPVLLTMTLSDTVPGTMSPDSNYKWVEMETSRLLL